MHQSGVQCGVQSGVVRVLQRRPKIQERKKTRAHGGTNCEFNIRILCSAHNQLMADKILGEPFMRAKRYANSTDFDASTG